ncbi:glutathione S-transferase family protein [Alcanivorax sp. 1008]|uniref:glutathione S-transferase family protein n=1 Tax=Alcanivorax sp. 1008 TaxID=2816853 RepID=UPI001E14F1C5|nr:glutathione S-transferase family protein [Alcanivorax sp. 1008]MCC1497228.1 glutathione S-transferase family protein [Alcanivorax sp. 1008]
MSDLILHHYAMSPFAEKIRAMLGYADLSWLSVAVPEMPPRKALQPLAGKYRKIPVMQIGADVFCDTRAISSEIARLCGKPELALENCSEEVQSFVRHTDLQVFLACVLSAPGGTLLRKLWKGSSLLNVARFLRDRINMGRTASVKAAGPKRAKVIVREQLEDMEGRLAEQPFLFGDKPCIADFSAYHGMWFIRDLGESRFIDRYSKVSEWMNRMRGFGHGDVTVISADQALDAALAVQPRALAGDADGALITIAPDDYGQTAVQGKLVAETDQGWVIARENSRVGRVHVHFPKQGYVVTTG